MFRATAATCLKTVTRVRPFAREQLRRRCEFSTASGSSSATPSTKRLAAEKQSKQKASPPQSPPPPPKFAVVNHASAYEAAMKGLHGQQLRLAQLEGIGKDDPDFDPFIEEELEEQRLHQIAAAEEAARNKTEDEEQDDENDNNNPKTREKEQGERILNNRRNPNAQRMDKTKYNNDGSLKRNKSELAVLRAGAPAGGCVAVIALAGSQFKVTTDDVLIVNRLAPVEKYAVGSIHTLTDQDVLLVSCSSQTLVGIPYVPGAEVDVLVEEVTRDAKIVIFKKRRRKHSKRRNGFRRDITMLRILDIRFPAGYDDVSYVERPDPAPLVQHPKPLYMPPPEPVMDQDDQIVA